jgi:hypothetical protein
MHINRKLLTVLLSALSGPLWSNTLETIDVTGERMRARSASEGFVGNDQIGIRPLLRTGEVLELVPGMVVTQHSGTGKANQYFLRGFNLDHGTDFATYLDGMPLNMRTHGHGQGYTDLNPVIPEALAGLHYRKGAYYSEIGDFSGAGSAQLHTIKAMPNHEVQLTIGEDNYSRLVTLGGTEATAGDWLYALEHTRYDGPWSDIEEDLRKTNVLLSYNRSLQNGRWGLTLMAYDNDWNSADQIPQRAVDQGLIDALGSIDPSLGGESSRYSLNGYWQRNDLKVSLYAVQSELQLWSNFTYFLDDPTNGDQFEQVDDRRIYGGEAIQNWSLSSPRPTRLSLGIQWRYDRITDVGLHRTRDRQRFGTIRRDSVDETSGSLFTEVEIALTDKLRSNLGLRYDYFDFDVTDRAGTNINGINLSSNSGGANESRVSLKATLAYALHEQWETYAAIGEGFHSNDARGTTIQIDPADGSAVTQVDPLVPSLGYEVGIRGQVVDALETSLAVWALELDSELVFVGDAGATEASAASKRWGMELTANYRITPHWNADLEYAWTDAAFTRDTGGGQHIPGSIRNVAQLGVTYAGAQQWFGSLRLRYFGERPLVEDASVESDESLLLNLRIGKTFGQWSVYADILNLLDSDDHDIDYYYASQLPGETTPVEDTHFHILEPRTLRLTAKTSL